MTFRFKLERVREHREELVKDVERRLEAARLAVQRLRELLVAKRDEYLAERDDLNVAIARGELHKVSLFESSLETRKRHMLEILERQSEIKQEIDVLEQALVQTRRDLKAVENLRDTQKATYDLEESRREQKHLDELAGQAFLRRARAGE